MSLTKKEFWNEITKEQNENVLLETAIREIQRAARIINRFENLSDVTFEDLQAASKSLHLALTTLALILGDEPSLYN